MMTIDMTATMAPVMWGVVGALVVSLVGIVITMDRNELPQLRLRAMRSRLRRALPVSPRRLNQPSLPAVVSGF